MQSLTRRMAWAGRQLARVGRVLSPSPAAWRGAAIGALSIWGLWVLAFVFLDIVPLPTESRAIGDLALFGAFALDSLALLIVLSILAALPMIYRAALCLAFPPTAMFFLIVWSPLGGLSAAGLAVLAVSLVGGAVVALKARPRRAWHRAAVLLALVLGLGTITLAVVGFFQPPAELNPSLAGVHLADRTIDAPDPSLPGPHGVETFTYGSGHDLRRADYAQGVRFRTKSVDGSKLDSDWTGARGWIRKLYWGFDPTAFPVQGRVWMPKGPGPFPLVLIVHGNHQMEQPSEGGYAYLARRLASQGFIAVSVDENFLNSSRADFIDILKPRMGAENDARAWMLLEHLAQWRAWTTDPTHPLFGRADMSRIALIGHSRGGEAVATAAAFNQLDRYPDDAGLAFHSHFNIRAVAAIAPVDGQYRIHNRPPPRRDVNYFTLHGSMDGDMTSFMGASQYARDTLSGTTDAFKATLYVKDANHGQFNRAWGRNDMGSPFDFLLDERPILPPASQEAIALTYLTAFLQATVNDRPAYRALFMDARWGARWLPDGVYLNNYADSRTIWLADFDEDLDPATGTLPGVRISGRNLTVWKETTVDLKWAPLDTTSAILAWDDRAAKGSSYTLDLAPGGLALPGDAQLVFSAASAEIPTLPAGSPLKEDPAERSHRVLDWTLVLVDAAGHEARLPLSHDQALHPQIRSETRRLAVLDTTQRSEVVLRRFSFPLADFRAAIPGFDPAHLRSVRFDFDRSPRGAIVLDDVGLHGATAPRAAPWPTPGNGTRSKPQP